MARTIHGLKRKLWLYQLFVVLLASAASFGQPVEIR